MRSLFLKVFLWFWLAMILVIASLGVTTYITRIDRTPRPPQFIQAIMSAYSHHAVETYEREGSDGGAAALDSFLQGLEQEANIRAHLFGADGNELAGRDATSGERELAARVVRTHDIATKMIGNGLVLEARPEQGRETKYAFVATLTMSPPSLSVMPQPAPKFISPESVNFLFGESLASFILRLVAVILTAGVLCYLLARYIVSPVIKLREVTRQVAGGDLSARVSPALGRRRDELAELGHDFDLMAARIEKLMSAQQRLLRDISHELRSPLARLSVALDLARRRAGPDAVLHHARIEREAVRLNEMIGQLLVLTRWESDGDRIRHKPLNLCTLVRDVAADADFEAQGRNCSVIVTECDECEISGTPAMLRSAVENIVRNAVRYTPERTTVKISLRYQQKSDGGGEAVIAVHDDGAGVPEELLTDIFRSFYRMDDSRTRETGGTGLGLAIAERAVRLHNGTIMAANVPEGGFVVEVRLPMNTET